MGKIISFPLWCLESPQAKAVIFLLGSSGDKVRFQAVNIVCACCCCPKPINLDRGLLKQSTELFLWQANCTYAEPTHGGAVAPCIGKDCLLSLVLIDRLYCCDQSQKGYFGVRHSLIGAVMSATSWHRIRRLQLDVLFKPQSFKYILPFFIGNTALSHLPLKPQVLQSLFFLCCFNARLHNSSEDSVPSRAWFSELPLRLLTSIPTQYTEKRMWLILAACCWIKRLNDGKQWSTWASQVPCLIAMFFWIHQVMSSSVILHHPW